MLTEWHHYFFSAEWVNIPMCHKVLVAQMPRSVSIDNESVPIENHCVSIDNESVSIDNRNVSIDNANQRLKAIKQRVALPPVFIHLFYLFHLFQGPCRPGKDFLKNND